MNNRVAFGTFVDKPVETFVGTLAMGRFVLKYFCHFGLCNSVLTDNLTYIIHVSNNMLSHHCPFVYNLHTCTYTLCSLYYVMCSFC